MNINDPFGRMKTKREREYQSLIKSLREAGVTTRRDAIQLQETLDKRLRMSLMLVIPVTAILTLLFQQYWSFIAVSGTLIVVWLLKITSRGKQYVARYIEEELSDDNAGADSFTP